MLKRPDTYPRAWALWLLILLIFWSGTLAAQAQPPTTEDDTMLMFVGETQPIVTVASLSPEAPTTAPAMATVVGREEIARRGYLTLGELLEDQPGFFIGQGGRGSVPYLRGLRDSVLFLYDGVPMTTDVTKTFAPLDRELSLSHVERVEIVRGPGSVLWGADAFAGVVNIVPRRGQQGADTRLGVELGNQQLLGGLLSRGFTHGPWNGWLGASVTGEDFHSPDFMGWDEQGGVLEETVDPSQYAELVGTLNYGNWLHVSGRWSDFSRNYTLRDADESIIWDGTKETPVNLVKVSLSKIFGPSHYALTTYYQETRYKVRDSDVERQQRNSTSHLELLWDRRVLGRGLVTAGASWRQNNVDDALVQDGFQPDFLQPGAPLFKPALEQQDFSSEVYALYGQFRYRWQKLEGWLGARYEDHSDYSAAISASMGVQAPLGDRARAKLTYGNAFRTPYSRQLFDDTPLNQEKITTLSAQLNWTPAAAHNYELTLFHSRIEHHRSEDPYGGLSLESDHAMYGAELAVQFPLSPVLTARAGLSWFETDYSQERFNVLVYSIVSPDGSREDVYEDWAQPADNGPGWLARLSLDWAIADDSDLRISLSAGGEREASYLKGTVRESYRTPVLVDLAYRRPGFIANRDQLSLRVTNLFDRSYQQPDVYGPVPAEPRRISLLWSLAF